MSKKTEHLYPFVDGSVCYKSVRTDHDDGTKTFAQFHRDEADQPWEARAPSWLRPLFNLPEIDWAPDNSFILVVEGEKTALAAQALFGDSIIVTTWAGGCNAVKKTDWGPLKRHRVVIWYDFDMKTFPEEHASAGRIMPMTMQPGFKASAQIALASGGAIVEIPQEFVEAASWVVTSGWDLADDLPEGFGLDHVKSYIRSAFTVLAEVSARADAGGGAEAGGETHSASANTHTVDSGDNISGRFPTPDDSMSVDIIPPVPSLPTRLNGHRLRFERPPNDDGILFTANGGVRPCFENACVVIEHNLDTAGLRYDLFGHKVYYGDRPLEDQHILVLARAVQRTGVIASTQTIGEAVVACAQERCFHPVLNYLDGLKWDGYSRLDMWLIDHIGAEDTPLARAMSAKWLIQAIARIRDPGCQADAMLILEGEQGTRKSSLLKALFGNDWFTDHLPDLSQKDAQLQLLGIWCVEVAELATLGRSDAAKIKAFLTSRVDRFRPPYGKVAKDFPRSCVFAGTVNPAGGYLKDPTGGRRFWPVACADGKIDVNALVSLRDQIWAEADMRYKANEPWWIDDKQLEHDARAAQDDRREDDVWEHKVAEYLIGKTRVSVGDVLDQAVGMYKAADWGVADQGRVGRILTSFGWRRRQVRDGAKRRWMYEHPDTLLGDRRLKHHLSPDMSGDKEGSGDEISWE